MKRIICLGITICIMVLSTFSIYADAVPEAVLESEPLPQSDSFSILNLSPQTADCVFEVEDIGSAVEKFQVASIENENVIYIFKTAAEQQAFRAKVSEMQALSRTLDISSHTIKSNSVMNYSDSNGSYFNLGGTGSMMFSIYYDYPNEYGIYYGYTYPGGYDKGTYVENYYCTYQIARGGDFKIRLTNQSSVNANVDWGTIEIYD